MAIRFVLPEQESESVAFAYSPVVEAVLSLHVLVAPRHHPLQHAWVRRMRKLEPKLRAEIQAFREEAAPKLPSGELVEGYGRLATTLGCACSRSSPSGRALPTSSRRSWA